MRVEFEKPLFNKDDRWIGTEPAFGTILHWGVSTDERNRGDGVTIVLYSTENYLLTKI